MTSEDADGGCSVLKGEEGGAWRAATFVVAGENFCALPFEGGDPGDVGCCGNATEPKSLREGDLSSTQEQDSRKWCEECFICP